MTKQKDRGTRNNPLVLTPEQFREWRLSMIGVRRHGKTHTGWSQQDAADFFERSIKTVQAWESGRRNIPKKIIRKVREMSGWTI